MWKLLCVFTQVCIGDFYLNFKSVSVCKARLSMGVKAMHTISKRGEKILNMRENKKRQIWNICNRGEICWPVFFLAGSDSQLPIARNFRQNCSKVFFCTSSRDGLRPTFSIDVHYCNNFPSMKKYSTITFNKM